MQNQRKTGNHKIKIKIIELGSFLLANLIH